MTSAAKPHVSGFRLHAIPGPCQTPSGIPMNMSMEH
jgi:hypothetical protein